MVNETSAPADSLRGAAKTKFRVLQQHGRKLGLRLELIFWSQLAEYAKRDQVSLSTLVFGILATEKDAANMTSVLRCYCLDRQRRSQATSPLAGQSFDLLAMVSACPSPVAIITPERKLVAFNPAFSILMRTLRENTPDAQRAIQLTFSEPVPRIQRHLLDRPTDIRNYHVGLQIGDSKQHNFSARFALADRTKEMTSLIAIYLIA
jgi:predicted DNA-binding ribbon-helix-helix protein